MASAGWPWRPICPRTSGLGQNSSLGLLTQHPQHIRTSLGMVHVKRDGPRIVLDIAEAVGFVIVAEGCLLVGCMSV